MAVEEVDEEGKFVRLRNKSNEVGLWIRVLFFNGWEPLVLVEHLSPYLRIWSV